MMKKIFVFLIAFAFLGSMIACKNNTTTTSISKTTAPTTTMTTIDKATDVVRVEESLSRLTISNSFISASFDLDHGNLVSLINVPMETDYLSSSIGGNWAMTVDVSTGNPFYTNYKSENAVLVTNRTQIVEYSIDNQNDNVTVTFVWDVSFTHQAVNYSGIKITQTVKIQKGSEELIIDYEIDNQGNQAMTVVNFTGSQLSGLKDSSRGDLNLFWSNKEGKIYDSAIDKIKNAKNQSDNLVNVYPGLYSTQLIQLYNNSESLYVIVEDDTREYKIANYGNFTDSTGYDFNGVGVEDSISLSFTQFPFVAHQETKTVHTTVIGVGLSQKWYAGADRYQTFLREHDMLNEYNDFVENWAGFIALVGSHYGSKHFSSYTPTTEGGVQISYADWINNINDSSGIDTEVILGWNDGGFDSMYPDYEFALGDGFNGEVGFETMANQIHANGDLFILHMNSRIADELGKWSQSIIDEESGLTKLYYSSVKRAGFRPDMPLSEYEKYMIGESYSTGTLYFVMSSGSSFVQENFKDAATRIREKGANGIWFDGLYEKDAYLDYDERHKANENSTPATIYGEGYLEILSSFDEIGSSIKPELPWIIIAGGGAGDAFALYTDVYGGNWNRKLGARDNSADNSVDLSGTENSDRHLMTPEITAYTIPAIYIGQAGAGTLAGQSDEYARAFLLGSPFLVEQNTTSTAALLAIYNYYPDIFFNGLYREQRGLSVSSSDIMASIIISENNDAFALQIYNYNASPSGDITISIDLNQLGLDGNLLTATDLFNGSTINFVNNTITVSLPAQGFTSLHIDLGK